MTSKKRVPSPPHEKNGRRRLSAEDRHKQLLSVAVAVFSKHGFEATTTKAIADAAGVSEGIIFQHFATKDDLYADILDYKAQESGVEEWKEELRKCAERCDDEGLVRSLVERILQSLRLDPQFHRLMYQAALGGHALPKIMAERRLPFFSFLRDYIVARQKQGVFRACDPGVAVLAMLSMPTYYVLTRTLLGISVLKLSEREMIRDFTQLILNGLQASPTGDCE
jgi:AcrR family transcriptional regulator